MRRGVTRTIRIPFGSSRTPNSRSMARTSRIVRTTFGVRPGLRWPLKCGRRPSSSLPDSYFYYLRDTPDIGNARSATPSNSTLRQRPSWRNSPALRPVSLDIGFGVQLFPPVPIAFSSVICCIFSSARRHVRWGLTGRRASGVEPFLEGVGRDKRGICGRSVRLSAPPELSDLGHTLLVSRILKRATA